VTTTLIPIICGVVAALAVVALTPLAAHLARAVGAVAEPKGRSIHSKPTPLLGGLAILAGFLIPVIYYLPAFDTPAKALVVGGILIALLGAVDDVIDLSPAVKLIGQAACALIPVAAGLTIDHLTLPFVGVGDLGPAQYPVTVLWFVALANMINFTDGMDGLAAGVSGIGLTTFAILAASLDRATPAIIAASLAGAAIGFLAHNFHPARVFMGDAGSLLLGFVIAGVAVSGVMKSAAAVAIGLPLIVLAIPILDTSFVILKRIKHGMPVYSADKSHFHHRFFTIGWSQRRTVLALYAWCTLMSAVAIVISLHVGGAIGVSIALGAALVAGVYLVYLLEILKWGGTPIIDIVRGKREETGQGVARQIVTAALRGRTSPPER
jgi:UDP-GlcNAc:undecaprenyl-phosphate/decaprenyl-phosphate GlcNAc-1-phosphate transferase